MKKAEIYRIRNLSLWFTGQIPNPLGYTDPDSNLLYYTLFSDMSAGKLTYPQSYQHIRRHTSISAGKPTYPQAFRDRERPADMSGLIFNACGYV